MTRKERRALAFGKFSATRTKYQTPDSPQGINREIFCACAERMSQFDYDVISSVYHDLYVMYDDVSIMFEFSNEFRALVKEKESVMYIDFVLLWEFTH